VRSNEIYILQDRIQRNQHESRVLPKLVSDLYQNEMVVSILPQANVSQTAKGFFLRLFHMLYEAI
jgi:hypothetical protein